MHLVLFDIDGTVVNSYDFDGPLYVQAVESVLGVRIDSDWSLYQHVTDSGILEEVISSIGRTADSLRIRQAVQSNFIDLVSDYLDQRNGVVSEIPGARAFIKRLVAHPEVAIAFATGGWEETAIMKLNGIGLNAQEHYLASASDSVSRTEIMQLAEARALGTTAATKRTYFGDGVWDQKASAELGYDFVGIGEKLECAARFPDFVGGDAIMSSLGLLD